MEMVIPPEGCPNLCLAEYPQGEETLAGRQAEAHHGKAEERPNQSDSDTTADHGPFAAPPPPDVMEEVHAEELTKREQTRKAGLGLTKPQGNIGKASKKKDKRKQKRTNLLQKLQATELIKEKEKKAAQEQGAPLSSVSDLLSALMQRETSNSSERHKADTTARLTTHKKTKIMTSEVEQFKNVLAHPAFQRDPMAAIKEHLSNKVAFMNTSSRQQNRSNKGKGKKK